MLSTIEIILSVSMFALLCIGTMLLTRSLWGSGGKVTTAAELKKNRAAEWVEMDVDEKVDELYDLHSRLKKRFDKWQNRVVMDENRRGKSVDAEARDIIDRGTGSHTEGPAVEHGPHPRSMVSKQALRDAVATTRRR